MICLDCAGKQMELVGNGVWRCGECYAVIQGEPTEPDGESD